MEQYGLDELIQDLQQRGVDKGEQQAQEILENAKVRAEQIVTKAQHEADEIVARANTERQSTKASLDAELRQAVQVGLAAFRQAIENGFVVPEIRQAVHAAVTRPGFLEDSIAEIVRAFARQGMTNADIEVLLPEAQRQELGDAFIARLAAKGASGVKVRFDDSLTFGFRIGPAKGGFFFDLSDDGLRQVLEKFVSPRFRASFYPDTDSKLGSRG